MSSWRDTTCGVLSAADAGKRVKLAGWADTRRDHGGLVFIDLRDFSGKVQLVVNPERAPEAAAVAHEIRNEFVLQAEGEVVLRAPEAVNPNLPTGEIEVQVDTLTIVSRSEPLPFQIGERRRRGAAAQVPLARHAQRPHAAQPPSQAHRHRRDPARDGRRSSFVDVWTPIMTKGTPEGARDFLVPVRLQPGKFFALAQSPQLFKQLCMVGGLDRYYQIATCWRDEDLRADRQFEFRQLDLEMSFVDREDVLDVLEAAVVASFDARRPRAAGAPVPALDLRATRCALYGTDKPDFRFGLEIEDATELTRTSEFGVFAKAPTVRYIVAPRAFSRAELGRLEEIAKEWGAKGLAYLVNDGGEIRSPIAKFLSEQELAALTPRAGVHGALRRRRRARSCRASSAACARTSAASSSSPSGQPDASTGSSTSRSSSGTRRRGGWTFMHHPVHRRRCRATRRRSEPTRAAWSASTTT